MQERIMQSATYAPGVTARRVRYYEESRRKITMVLPSIKARLLHIVTTIKNEVPHIIMESRRIKGIHIKEVDLVNDLVQVIAYTDVCGSGDEENILHIDVPFSWIESDQALLESIRGTILELQEEEQSKADREEENKAKDAAFAESRSLTRAKLQYATLYYRFGGVHPDEIKVPE